MNIVHNVLLLWRILCTSQIHITYTHINLAHVRNYSAQFMNQSMRHKTRDEKSENCLDKIVFAYISYLWICCYFEWQEKQKLWDKYMDEAKKETAKTRKRSGEWKQKRRQHQQSWWLDHPHYLLCENTLPSQQWFGVCARVFFLSHITTMWFLCCFCCCFFCFHAFIIICILCMCQMIAIERERGRGSICACVCQIYVVVFLIFGCA